MFQRNYKSEKAALALLTFYPDIAIMPVYKFLAECKTQPGALFLFRALGFVIVIKIKTSNVVDNEDFMRLVVVTIQRYKKLIGLGLHAHYQPLEFDSGLVPVELFRNKAKTVF